MNEKNTEIYLKSAIQELEKDYEMTMKLIDMVSDGQIKFPDDSKVETLFIDTLTVFATCNNACSST